MKREAMFYEFLSDDIEFKKYLSAYYGFDNENFILFRKWEKKATSLFYKIQEFKKGYDSNNNQHDFFALIYSSKLDVWLENTGKALSIFHKNLATENTLTKTIKPYFSPIEPSIVFLFDESNIAYYSDFGNSKSKLFSDYLKNTPPIFREKLVTIIKSWNDDTIIHNDFKSSNVLIQEKGNNPSIIDWELASVGDSTWDLASLLAELIAEFYVINQHYASLKRVFYLFNSFLKSYNHIIDEEKLVGFTAIKLLDYSIQQGKIKDNSFVKLAEEFITEPDILIGFL
ncbi:MAG: aminoglycoside phosphotransferase family protein [Arcicella sp.]|nr:aminoglycoside phosphotransferase family protein [Arcicella sp.]